MRLIAFSALIALSISCQSAFGQEMTEEYYQSVVKDMKSIKVDTKGLYPVERLGWLRASCSAVASRWAAQNNLAVDPEKKPDYGQSDEGEICRRVDDQSVLR